MSTDTNQVFHDMDQYRNDLDTLHFSREEKTRMAARLAEAATDTKADVIPFKATRKRLPLVAVAASIALALGLGGIAYASGTFVSVSQFVSHLFGAGEASVEIVDKVGHPVGVAQSVNGVTVSADAIIGDKTNVAVIFSIAKDDGTPFEGIEALDDGLLALGFSDHLDVDFPLISMISQGYGATGSAYFYDADPSDNAIQLVETRSYDSDGDQELSLIGRTMTAHLADLTRYDENGEATVIAEGNWTLSFPLDYEDASIALPTGQSFVVNGVEATIDKLVISPIALRMRYTVQQKVEWTSDESGRQSEHDSELADSLLGVDVSLNMANGTAVEVMSNGGGRISEAGDVADCETGIFFDRILDLDEIASVTIGGTTIEL